MVIKRRIDFTISAAALIVLSPLFFFIAVLVRLSSPGPVFFRQQRLGKDGVPFAILKFRTMYHNQRQVKAKDGSCLVSREDPRLTSLGRFLREFALDEIPQLLNVVKGEMSLVGPRPDQLDQMALYDSGDRRKLAMKPGITSLAMISGRNAIPWKERIRIDIWYIEHYSLWLDLKIMVKTVPIVLFRQGVYSLTQG